MYVFAQVTCICTDEGIGRFPDQNVPEKKKFVDKNVNITKNKKNICFGKKITNFNKIYVVKLMELSITSTMFIIMSTMITKKTREPLS